MLVEGTCGDALRDQSEPRSGSPERNQNWKRVEEFSEGKLAVEILTVDEKFRELRMEEVYIQERRFGEKPTNVKRYQPIKRTRED